MWVASASHRGVAASFLDQSELHGGFRCKATPTARCLVPSAVRQALSTGRSASNIDEHAPYSLPDASHRGAATSLLDLVRAAWRLPLHSHTNARCLVPSAERQALSTGRSASSIDEHAPFTLLDASHRGAAASLLDLVGAALWLPLQSHTTGKCQVPSA